MKVYCALLSVWLIGISVEALGPHEVLLLVNSNSEDSVQIAACFAELRHVPDINIVRLDLPADADHAFSMSHIDYTRLVWTPADTALRERGLSGQVLAWVFSTGFPAMIRGKPDLSIQGITFLRNKWPEDPILVTAGRYASPLFAGRTDINGSAHYAQSFDNCRRWLKDDMPLPSMMLGYIGPRGNTREEILGCLSRGAQSDGSRPGGVIYLVDTDDIRSKCREWQFPMVRAELKNMGLQCIITNALPRGRKDVMGIMMGTPVVDFSSANEYLPGTMAEHLTSLAAVFTTEAQTKLTGWIRAGATASAGTVTEPMDIWMKFPDARFFVYQASGCCIMESFYQAIRCPLQILLVGDPFAGPWAPKGAEIKVEIHPEADTGGTAGITFKVESGDLEYFGKMVCLIDGIIVENDSDITIRAKDFADGKDHQLRAVGFRTGLVRNQVLKTLRFRVEDGKVLFPDVENPGNSR